MKRINWQWLTIILIILGGCVIFLTGLADARVGGGHSYSGGGGYSSGGGSYSGGGDGGFIFYILFRLIILCFECPILGIPLLIITCIILWHYWTRMTKEDINRYTRLQSLNDQSSSGTATWTWGNEHRNSARSYNQGLTGLTGYSSFSAISQFKEQNREQAFIGQLSGADPNFSLPLFLDFVGLLYSKVQIGRTGDLSEASCFLAPDLRSRLCRETGVSKVSQISNVIVGSVTILKYARGGGYQKLVVRLETNYTELRGDKENRIYAVEEWTLARKDGILSLGPDKISSLSCPSCGSPAELDASSACKYCSHVILDGSFAWVLVLAKTNKKKNAPDISLDNGVERGTDLPTVLDPKFDANRKAFALRHPEFQWVVFEKRIEAAFMSLQEAWSSGQWEKARPFETDHLFATHRYWIEGYKQQGLRNKVENVVVNHVVPVKLSVDAFYDCITVRIWASCLDWTEKVSNGTVVSGSKTKKRSFTEYWTFIRRSNFQEPNVVHLDPTTCPNCGAPLQIGMSGICEYCDAKITNGSFDWTLSRIEQDEVYRG